MHGLVWNAKWISQENGSQKDGGPVPSEFLGVCPGHIAQKCSRAALSTIAQTGEMGWGSQPDVYPPPGGWRGLCDDAAA